MSISAPPEVVPEALPLATRKEIARLRAIMYDNAEVHLSTSVADGGRWLSDHYVIVDVTGSPAVERLEDGAYKLTAGKGLVRLHWKHKDVNDGEAVPRPSELDVDAYFGKLARTGWQDASPSEWSVAEHPGKAMLFRVHAALYTNGPGYALLGEETWATLRKTFTEPWAQYATELDMNVFRILAVRHGEGCGDPETYCGHRPVVVAYAAGIRCPEGQEEIASAIARLAESTSNQLEVA